VIPSSSTVSTRPLRSSAVQPMQRNDTQYGAAASIDQHGAVDGDAVITSKFLRPACMRPIRTMRCKRPKLQER
jgi:hypothetical protein